ncbi:hypothetical protein ACUJ46_09135 [Sandaracinobacteroides sp. A072]|uniref:hypothetical protein n=1 Tax=Sandaracinobacteroides sp. A072 TaxID=3461146 RepID=UPI004041762E
MPGGSLNDSRELVAGHFQILKDKQRAIRHDFPDGLALRVHRAISWLGRAEAEHDDDDLRFILLWVGFNSAYASEVKSEIIGERGIFGAFFETLVALDADRRIYNAVWQRFSQEIRLLLSNKYVFQPFWNHHNGMPGHENWADRLASSQRSIAAAMGKQDTARILSLMFDRLYVLRNQLVHGGATWNSKVNRDQVRDGASVLGFLLPVFIDIMMDNSGHNWGLPFYPVVD